MVLTCVCPAEAGSATCELREGPVAGRCPTCGGRGKAVEDLTVKALLAVPLTEVRPAGYCFCRTATCPTVYFASDGQQQFTEASLRERVHQKHPQDDDVFVCYCFRHTPGSIRAELGRPGRAGVIETVTTGI